MSNALFLSSRWIDGAIVTASSVQGMLTADNVQKYRPDQVWRATGCTAEWLAWDFGRDVAVNAVVLIGHNLSANATLRVRLAASAADVTADPIVDSGFVSAWPSSGKPSDPDWPFWLSLVLPPNGLSETEGGFHFVTEDGVDSLVTEAGDSLVTEDFSAASTATAFRYGRIDIVDPTNTDGYVQVGRLSAGPAFVPYYNLDINPSLGLVSPGEVTRSPFGRTFMDDRGPASRVLLASFTALDEAEMADELFELQRFCGTARDFVFCIDPEATTTFHKFSMQARFDPPQPAQGQPFQHESGRKAWQATLTLAEVL